MVLDTARLRLHAYAPAHFLAMMEGVAAFEASTRLRAAEGLCGFVVSDEVSSVWLERLRAAPRDLPDPWACGFGVEHRAEGLVIGSGGFKGPPDADGAAEIAYGVLPAYQGRGFATELAAALTQFALATPGVRVVRAHTLPEPNASTRVLSKCGFHRAADVVDPEDGPVWRWEYDASRRRD
jgi:RimJ/RimL family protein N-acetyltransferase